MQQFHPKEVKVNLKDHDSPVKGNDKYSIYITYSNRNYTPSYVPRSFYELDHNGDRKYGQYSC